tara:strand:- start:112 stop:498 length:387 start_codon:yes stop_codon:yes gene_type:complete
MADDNDTGPKHFTSALYVTLLVVGLTLVYVLTDSDRDASGLTEASTEVPVPAATATLDVFLPAAACAEIVSQDYEQPYQYAKFEVLCRDAEGTYTGFRGNLEREIMRKTITRFDYHFVDQDEMTIAER